ncbi:MAG: DUF4339 domain-containing protein [Verrucomicrobiota bacterium]
MEVYIFSNGEQKGPYSLAEVKTLLILRGVSATDLYWHEALKEWTPLSDLDLIEAPDTPKHPPMRLPAHREEKYPNGGQRPPKSHTSRNVTAGILLALILGFLGFFHIVHIGSDTFQFITKEHFTFKMTFTSVHEVLEEWNNQSFYKGSHPDPILKSLFDELARKKLITTRKQTTEELMQRLKKSLPDD